MAEDNSFAIVRSKGKSMNASYVTILNQARQNAAGGDPQKALALLKRLLEISRSDKEVQASAYFEIGKVYTNISKDDVAVKFFQKAMSICPEVLIQEFDWVQDLKRRNKEHVFDEIEIMQSQFSDYLRDQTKDVINAMPGYVPEPRARSVSVDSSLSAKPKQTGAAGSTEAMRFAGFWKRVIASIVDCLSILFIILVLVVILVRGFGLVLPAVFLGGVMGYFVLCFVSVLFLWLYYAIMESSRCQGTLGKMLLGIYVADEYGRRIGVGRASGRYFLKVLLYSVPLLGVIDCGMVLVTEKKQAWHDMPVGCLVLCR